MEWTSEQLCRARCYGKQWWFFDHDDPKDIKELEEWRKKALTEFGGSENIKCQDCALNKGCSPICCRVWDPHGMERWRNPHIIPDEIYIKGAPCPHFVDKKGLDWEKILSLQSKAAGYGDDEE